MLPSRSSQQLVSAPPKHKFPLPQHNLDTQPSNNAGEQQQPKHMNDQSQPCEVASDHGNGPISQEADVARLLDARKQKRFTLTLPVTTNFHTLQTSGPTSPIPSVAPSQAGSDDAARPPTPSDTNYLTAIAAQERRVLELKEELVKAEQALYKLKKDWAVHEVNKKRQDIRRMRSTRSGVNTPASGSQKCPEDSIVAQEVERRRAMHYNSKTSNRTVFSGSKHARTLSLLSPELMNGSFPTTLSQERQNLEAQHRIETSRISHKRVVSGEMQRSKSYDDNTDLDMPREVLMRAGRQMATDFKDGLWTFLEDLRQVTVGEEVANGTRVRPMRTDMPAPARTTKERRSKTGVPSPNRAQKVKRPVHPAQQKPPQNIEAVESVGEPSPKDSAVGFDDRAQPRGHDVEIHVQDSPITRKTPRRRSIARTSDHRQSPEKQDDAEGWDSWDSPQGHPPPEESERQNGKDGAGDSYDHG
ncbi:hypothetical protein K461DRAFT_140182 [Myriangium duriaei CBS 260.36]|uniref:DUF4048 domain-containing protein n=1 Tax=Myriangium duriaei CBS 260.36 TaxID=1168546 RepID=A0A9P4J2R3_9PEZI|nr:hypothetical protein K461DRAFT_140182 [Myriangium duriaei CBS 260.36]